MATLTYGSFGPFVPAGTIDALLREANLSDRIQTGLSPDATVAYLFHSDQQWTQRTSADGAHDIDNVDSSGVLGAALRRAYAKAAGLSTWSPAVATLAKISSPVGAMRADTGASTWTPMTRAVVWSVAGLGALVSGYHGYKRNNGSIGWGLAWAALGGLFPLVTSVVSLAQGYAKPMRRS